MTEKEAMEHYARTRDVSLSEVMETLRQTSERVRERQLHAIGQSSLKKATLFQRLRVGIRRLAAALRDPHCA